MLHRLANLRRGRSATLLRGATRGLAWRRGRTLVGLAQHIGDLVAAEPIARFLAQRDGQPPAWAVRRGLANIVRCYATPPHIVPLDSLTEWAGMAKTARAPIDLHIAGSWCDRHLYRHARLGCVVTRETYYDRPSLLHAFAAAGGLPSPETWGLDLTPRLTLPAEALAAIEALELPPHFIAMHCKSNQATRDWTDANWRTLAQRLTEAGESIVEVGLAPVCGDIPGVLDACGRLDVLGTAAVLARASLFVGIDSGPAHLANALGPPGVILLGSYGPFARYTPYSGRYASGGATLLHHDGPVAELPVDSVDAAVRVRLS